MQNRDFDPTRLFQCAESGRHWGRGMKVLSEHRLGLLNRSARCVEHSMTQPSVVPTTFGLTHVKAGVLNAQSPLNDTGLPHPRRSNEKM